MQWIASAAFGLEGLVKKELSLLGAPGRPVLGGVRFEGGSETAFRANLCLRTADRVQLLVTEGEALTFDMLFELVRAVRWDDYLTGDAAFPVSASCARSRLMSVRDCQAIAKKAIVESLRLRRRAAWFEETGPPRAVRLSIHENVARVTLDASGDALSRRGYRTWTGEAPLRETLAAAMVLLSPWRGDAILRDPFCGTATILIEAAFIRAKRAPGLSRPFAMEEWDFLDRGAFGLLREEACARFDPLLVGDIAGSDIDARALELGGRHIVKAGLEGRIRLEKSDVRKLALPQGELCLITNPPYGERLGDRKAAEALYRELGALAARTPGSSVCALSSHPGFERFFGKRATKKRRLYNGRLECDCLIFQPDSRVVSGSV